MPAVTILPSAGDTTSLSLFGIARSGSLKKYTIKKVKPRHNKAGKTSSKSANTKVVNAAAPMKKYPGLAIGRALWLVGSGQENLFILSLLGFPLKNKFANLNIEIVVRQGVKLNEYHNIPNFCNTVGQESSVLET